MLYADDKIIYGSSRQINGSQYELLAISDLTPTLSSLSAFQNTLFFACLLAVAFVVPLSWLLTRWLLKPFQKLAVRTSQLGVEKLSFRFDEPKQNDEYGILVKNFNLLLDNMEKSFGRIKRFASNASHELKTPLTVIRGEADLMLRREREGSEYRAALQRISSQSENLQKITDKLLLFADLERIEKESRPNHFLPERSVSGVIRMLERKCAEMGKSIKAEINTDGQEWLGHEELFSLVASNLIENALKYSRKNVRVNLLKKNKTIELSVQDDGPGIPEEERDKVFEPLLKTNKGSHTSDQGHGLGLAIVKACVDVQKGKINLDQSSLGGLLVIVTVPEPEVSPS